MDTDECIAMLHPEGIIIRYRNATSSYMPGEPYLVWLDNSPAGGMNISRQTSYRMKLMEVILHGCAPGTTPPTPQEMATAPYVNRRERVQNEAPRTVRWFQNTTPTVKDCDWTVDEWTDYYREQQQQKASDSCASTSAVARQNMMNIASEMIDVNTRILNEQRQSNRSLEGGSACIHTDTTLKDVCSPRTRRSGNTGERSSRRMQRHWSRRHGGVQVHG